MPFENTFPLVVVALVAAVGSLLWWVQARERWLVVTAALAAALAGGVYLADELVETDREQVTAVLHRLAAAAEARDLPTILATIDPEATGLRADAERLMQRYQPSEVRITRLFIEVDASSSPPAATADLIVRATGRVDGGGTQASSLVGGVITLKKQGEQWQLANFEFRRLFEGGLGKPL
jgi:alkanesulfonate monooxygenase SsuD/methylene tetrahydromethanopterin reductase-like flavin-dependent oxidoreductase (luciferase family)